MLVLWQLSWLAATLVAFLSVGNKFCRGCVLHGKMHVTAKLSRLWLLLKTRGIQYFLYLAHPDHNDLEVITIQPHTVGFLVLFTVHTTRRFLESLFVTSFGDAKMHASSKWGSIYFVIFYSRFGWTIWGCLVFLVGICHYVGTVQSVLFDLDSITPRPTIQIHDP
ncbi:hypothetical protein PsorP6_012868 [Peronosclerospora sorghi]|uniref:Uncharacterized protein n=1 Tax=Peronosclerospora sorghi TaxID=230839 RepID=A0ACC0WJA7_9STRA|nr:hypothetical protein PsorP6_012868 [Peronosclerospora sorghi]